MTDVTENTQPAETEQQIQSSANANGNQGPELNLNDLNSLRSIIDVASQRGAFKANEFEAVGKIYNRLTAFLETVTKKEQ